MDLIRRGPGSPSRDDFIRVTDDDDSEDDMYVSRSSSSGSRPASAADQDFIANARQDVPRLLAEVRRLRAALLD
jgi:hypothetical protein